MEPPCILFKPSGVPARFLDEIVLSLDEFEALRLADLEGLYQEQAAASMNISRPTFGRIIDSARNKTAQALIMGKVLRIEGGEIEMSDSRIFKCRDCQHVWEEPLGGGRPQECPGCGGARFCRENNDTTHANGCGNGRGARKRCCHRHA